MSAIDNIEREQNPLGTYTDSDLKRIIPYAEEKAAANQGGQIILDSTSRILRPAT